MKKYPINKERQARVTSEIADELDRQILEALNTIADKQLEDMPRYLSSDNPYLAKIAKEQLGSARG